MMDVHVTGRTMRTRRRIWLGGTAALALCGALLTPAAADTIEWQTLPFSNNSGGGISDAAWADDFQFAQPTTINKLRFWASGSPGGSQDFSAFSGTIGWAVHADVGGAPGAAIFSGATTDVTLTDTGVNNTFGGGSRIFQLDVNVGAISLPAGTYWWQFRENAINSPFDGTSIDLKGTSQPTQFLTGLRLDQNETNPTFAQTVATDIAFQLISVPGPATTALLLIGGAAMARRRRP